MKHWFFLILAGVLLFVSCAETKKDKLNLEVYQTSAAGDQLKLKELNLESSVKGDTIKITRETKYQTITGFGGTFTQSTAFLLNQLSDDKRNEVIQAYFSDSGSNYSLTRAHINSCDFSTHNYAYDSVPGDTLLKNFDISRDKEDVIAMILSAKSVSSEGFKIIASPWTAPPWMKDNNKWEGGKLLQTYYPTWALYFSKYIKAYRHEGIDIWGITVENEPLGNGENWESMHYTPEEMALFIKEHLGPKLKEDSLTPKILIYDQNRGAELEEWAEVMLTDEELSPYIYGTAVHWYSSTNDWFPESLNRTHEIAPTKHLINTEACVDAEVPKWKNDAWYWSKEATDWGFDWAPENEKPRHPKYVPVYRYARDIIGCLNNWVEGWIDWNMVLDKNGGPNWAKNWCVAPVLVDPDSDEVYYTPLYYTLAHFSKFIRPNATRIESQSKDSGLMHTAVENPDGTIALVVLNMSGTAQNFNIEIEGSCNSLTIDGQAIQTILIQKN